MQGRYFINGQPTRCAFCGEPFQSGRGIWRHGVLVTSTLVTSFAPLPCRSGPSNFPRLREDDQAVRLLRSYAVWPGPQNRPIFPGLLHRRAAVLLG